MRLSPGFNARFLGYLRESFKFAALYDEGMNQITNWVPIRMPGGKVDFGIAPFDSTPVYYGTWNGHDIMTLMFNRVDMSTVVLTGNSLSVNLDLRFEGHSVLGDYSDPFLQ
jgi:hypothetical protein